MDARDTLPKRSELLISLKDVSRGRVFFHCGLPTQISGTPLRILGIAEGFVSHGFRIAIVNAPLPEHLPAEVRAALDIFQSTAQAASASQFVYAIGSEGIRGTRRLARNSRSIFLIDWHGLSSAETPGSNALQKTKHWVYEWLIALLLSRARYVHMMTSTRLDARMKKLRHSTYLLQGGISESWLPNLPERSIESAPNRVRVIAYTGNTRSYQGLDELVQACDLLRTRLQFKLLLILSTLPESNLPGWVDVACSLTPTEALERVAEADVLVVPRRKGRIASFSFPSKVYEYLALGVPTLLSDALRPLKVESSVCTYRAGDVNALCDALYEICVSPTALTEAKVVSRYVREYCTYTALIQGAIDRLEMMANDSGR